jgi:Glycosyl hydrolases family 16
LSGSRGRGRAASRALIPAVAVGVALLAVGLYTRLRPDTRPLHQPLTETGGVLGASSLGRHCLPTALPAGRTMRRRKRCSSRDPSGQPAPRGNLPGWRLVFVDDFRSQIRLGSFRRTARWNMYPYPWHDTSAHGTYWPQQGLSTHDGVLDIWLHTENVNGAEVHVVNAPQPVIPGIERGQLYGRYAIRFRADPVAGYKTAWLLWPDSARRSNGEIDFPEGSLTGTMSAFVHPVGANSDSESAAFATRQTYRRWHTAVIVWTPGRCRFLLDGKQIGVDTHGIPDTPMHWVIQTETELSGSPPPDQASGHVYIDWVAVYARR